jgi:serine-type D-Ala-D-Ala carboxypeptidase/endopeptidase (penicillin-binding protein 4)
MLVLTAGYFATSHVARSVNALGEKQLTEGPAVAVLSARRTPTNLSNITRIGSLTRAMNSFSTQIPSNSCSRVDWLGRTVLDVNSATTATPASATKVVTAAVALSVLGPKHTYTTAVKSTALPTNGIIDNLYFVGGGDPLLSRVEYTSTEKYPTLSPTSLAELADKIAATGVRQVTGSIVVDDARYDAQRFVDVWPTDFRFTESGPLGALMVDDGVVLGQNMKPDDPALAAAAELHALLSQRGIFVSGQNVRGAVPPSATDLATVTSSPMTEVVKEMLTNSDNNTAELLLKEIGLVAKKSGSTAAGLQVVQETLAQWGIADVVMQDGSGLSSANKISCNVFAKLLARETKTLPSLLAVAGVSGTIRDSFESSSVKGRLVGKTGTLNGVKALVGYLPLEGEQPVMFSLILNRAGIDNKTAYRPIWNALGDALNRASATPKTDQLAP